MLNVLKEVRSELHGTADEYRHHYAYAKGSGEGVASF